MIFAAGLGTRLKPLTDTVPKALVPVGGKPLLDHLVRKLSRAGFTDLVVNVHHLADQVVSYVKENDSFGIDIRFSDESCHLLETGGGILHARNLLCPREAVVRSANEDSASVRPGDRFLAHNVDILSDLDFGWFVSNARQGALSNILVSERKTQRYFLFDDDLRLVGWTNVATGEVRSPYKGLDPAKCRKLAFAGVHLVSNEIFSVFEDEGWEGRFSIVDFYIKTCAEHPVYGVQPPRLRLLDIGKVDSLARAEDFLESLQVSCKESGPDGL